jgi:hypothetical protein
MMPRQPIWAQISQVLKQNAPESLPFPDQPGGR